MSLKKSLKDAKRKKKKAASQRHTTSGNSFSLLETEDTTVNMWLGYSSRESAAEESEENPTVLCMVCDINAENFAYFSELCPDHFKLGDWYVSGGDCEKQELHGAFLKLEQALEFARDSYGADYFRFSGW